MAQLTDCVNQGPAPPAQLPESLRATDAEPATYVIRFNVHVEEGGSVSSVDIDGSLLGGGAIEACMKAALAGARLPVRASSARSVPVSSRALMASAPAVPLPAPPLPPPPYPLHPVVLVGLGFIILVAVIVYIATRDPTDEEREKERCKKVKKMCIKRCTDEEIPTGKYDGMPYHKCLRECLEDYGCWGKTN